MYTGTAYIRRVKLVEQCAKARGNTGREKAEREAQKQHLSIGQRQEHITLHGHHAAQREQHDVLATPDAIDQ
ncbi:hypothetical protein D3C78_1758620 [compost metagenome]